MNFATLDLNLLRVLDAILTAGSTTKAGERLGVSQSAVSNALNRLRHALGDDLFVRRGNQLVPTDFAVSIKDGLREELNRLESLLSRNDDFDPRQASETFKIAASDFFAELLMPGLGGVLNRKAPKMVAQLVDLVPENYVESLERYNADLALIPDTDAPDWISREVLFRSSFMVVGRVDNPFLVQIEDGAELPMETFCALSHVLFSPEGKLAAMGDAALAKVGRKRHVAMTLPVFSGVCRVVSASDLVALVPSQLARKFAPEFGLKVLAPPFEIEPVNIIAIWHRRSDENPMAKWMRQQVFDLLKPLDTR
ncbi:LysR family transcriptional regulator [Ruegeria arenilitoris]|uniref:LysR family transcriptional regulator n=1 Tax=Ruegeria arenilitoris TaxID=1173585 RepID=UPI00147D7F38|nr:LysR family transcriptional regulator [Ruegeria arenilitoris]